MKVSFVLKRVSLLLILFNTLYCLASSSDICTTWRTQIDQVTEFEKGIHYSKEMFSRVSQDSPCSVQIEIEIAELFYRKLEVDSAMFYYDKAIKHAKKIGASEALSDAYNSKILILVRQESHDEIRQLLKLSRELLLPFPKSKSWIRYYEQSAHIAFETEDYYRAISYMDSTIIAAERSNYTVLIHETYEHLGYCYTKLGDYQKSTENFVKSLEMKEKYGYVKDLGGTYRNLGNTYLELKHYTKAQAFFEKSISVSRKQNHQLILMSSYFSLSRCYRYQKLNEEAEKALDSSSYFANKNVDKSFMINLLKEKGILYFKNYKNDQKAEHYFLEAYRSAKKAKDKTLLFQSIQSLIELYFFRNEYPKVFKLIKELEEIKNDIPSVKYEIYLSNIYAKYYDVTNQDRKALLALRKYHLLKDSIMNTEVSAKVVSLEKQYDTKKKELTIVNLNKEKEEQRLIVQKAKNQQILYLLASVFFLLLLVLGAWAFRKLRNQQKELLATNQVKNRLFSIIAHDLRGMIIPFQRSGKILKHHIDKGNHQKTIELSQALEKNSEGLSNMLDNLLNWSLEQMNGYKMQAEHIFVSEELGKIIEGYSQQAAYKKTKIELKYTEDVSVYMDKGAFHVIFRNLIGNALKYTEEGSIRIEFKKENSLFLCSVIDTGVGMNAEQLDDPFTLEEKKSTIGTQGEKGTGLGLNLVYRFIKMHQGTIDVSSEKRIGTRFNLSFPMIENQLKKKSEQTSISA